MLNALWLVIFGMVIIFIVLAVLWLAMMLVKKFVPAEEKKEPNKP